MFLFLVQKGKFGLFGHKRSKSETEADGFICPMDGQNSQGTLKNGTQVSTTNNLLFFSDIYLNTSILPFNIFCYYNHVSIYLSHDRCYCIAGWCQGSPGDWCYVERNKLPYSKQSFCKTVFDCNYGGHYQPYSGHSCLELILLSVTIVFLMLTPFAHQPLTQSHGW